MESFLIQKCKHFSDKNTVFVVAESRSIFYSSKIVYLQIDWFTGYNGIMTEH